MNRFGVALAAAASLTATACTFEHSSQLITPTMPSVNGSPAPGSGPFMGFWSSDDPLSDPSSWVCGSFQWNVTEQTQNSISGAFAGICAGVVLIEGTGSGQINGNDLSLSVNGQASVSGVTATCSFSLNGTGQLQGQDELLVDYSGSTCLGPVEGTETLRRPTSVFPPAPSSPSQESPTSNPYHVGPGPASYERAIDVLEGVEAEFPHLIGAYPTEDQAISAGEQFMLRFIWHLHQAGYNAGRQRNPSGAISRDKMTLYLDGRWRAFDVLFDFGVAHRPAQVIFLEVEPADHVPDGGIPD
jgi:hypothetical protein